MAWNLSDKVLELTFTHTMVHNPNGLCFSPDGLKAFVNRPSYKYVVQFSLSTPWDFNTASYVRQFYTGVDNTSGLQFLPDGSAMFLMCSLYQKRWELSTPWNVGTAIYHSDSASFENIDSSNFTGAFNPDGSKLYLNSYNVKKIVQIPLATPYLVTDKDVSAYQSISTSSWDYYAYYYMCFNDTGTIIYVLNYYRKRVEQRNLSTAWDIRTIGNEVSRINYPTYPKGCSISQDGNKFFMYDSSNNAILQYSLYVEPYVAPAFIPRSSII